MAGKKQKKSSGTKTKKKNTALPAGKLILVDPSRCRFQHSRIRPYFSGCGRSVYETLDDIKSGKTPISNLPPIQVLVGPADDAGRPWYFSLNNRRLWVFKRLREEGFLEKFDNKIAVRVRQPKSQQEKERYTVEKCSLEARVMEEKKKECTPTSTQDRPEVLVVEPTLVTTTCSDGDHRCPREDENPPALDSKDVGRIQSQHSESDDDDDDDDDSNVMNTVSCRNRFSTITIDDDSSSEEEEEA